MFFQTYWTTIWFVIWFICIICNAEYGYEKYAKLDHFHLLLTERIVLTVYILLLYKLRTKMVFTKSKTSSLFDPTLSFLMRLIILVKRLFNLKNLHHHCMNMKPSLCENLTYISRKTCFSYLHDNGNITEWKETFHIKIKKLRKNVYPGNPRTTI